MNYVYLTIAVLGIGFQLVFTKLYQRKAGDALVYTLLFNCVAAVLSLILFLILSQFQMRWEWFSVLLAALLAVVFSLNGLLAIKICSMGSVAVYTLFLMLGGMSLPVVYGFAFLREGFSSLRIVALLLMVVALVFQFMDTGKSERKEKIPKIFYVLCSFIFLTNGMASVLSKMHQDTSVFVQNGMSVATVSTNNFLVYTYAFMALINGGIFLVYLCKNKARKGDVEAQEGVKTKKFYLTILTLVLLYAVSSSVGYLMQLLGAKGLDASLLYPIVTGGTIVLGTAFGALFFREKVRLFGILSVCLAVCATVMFVF